MTLFVAFGISSLRFFSFSKIYARVNLLICVFAAGCGYRWQPEYPQEERPSVTVPFVVGDEDGMFTADIIAALSSSGLMDVVSFGGDYRLEVVVLGEEIEKIGFRVDPQKVRGKVRKNLLACEGRRNRMIEASLFLGEERVYGPYRITADAEYDYVDGDSIQDLTFIDSSGSLATVLPFSFGQLESIESAQEAAGKPLYRRLAQKIVDAISSNWYTQRDSKIEFLE